MRSTTLSIITGH